MSNLFAIDSNVAIYAFSKDHRRLVAMELLNSGPNISAQLLNEFVSASLRKRRVGWDEIEEALSIISQLSTSVRAIDNVVHDLGCWVAQRYQLGFYDSLIAGAALLDGCSILYSEDMQHGLVIDGRLTITNPFLSADPS